MTPSGGSVIRSAREARGYTRQEIASQYGVALSTLKNWEQNIHEPPFKTVFEILEMLGYSIEEIYDYANGRGQSNNKRSQSKTERLG